MSDRQQSGLRRGIAGGGVQARHRDRRSVGSVGWRAAVAAFALCASAGVHAEPMAWGPLAGTWTKLPVACGRNLESSCGGDHFTIKPGVLDARRTCAGVQLVIRDQSESKWQVDVVGKKECVWNARRVRSFVFTLGPTPDSLRLVAYSGPSAAQGEELFQGHGFERN